MARKVKITVVKRDLYKDLVDKYAADKNLTICNLFNDEQEFVLNEINMPEGFCSWAWADIHRDVVAVFFGASYKWINKENLIVSCCTDGLRPVTFKIEAIDE